MNDFKDFIEQVKKGVEKNKKKLTEYNQMLESYNNPRVLYGDRCIVSNTPDSETLFVAVRKDNGFVGMDFSPCANELYLTDHTENVINQLKDHYGDRLVNWQAKSPKHVLEYLIKDIKYSIKLNENMLKGLNV